MYGATCYGAGEFAGGEPEFVAEVTPVAITITSASGVRSVGDLWELVINIADEETLAPVDPPILNATIETPTEATAPVVLRRTAAGRYKAAVSLAMPQVWRIYVSATGTYQGAESADIIVLPRFE